MGKSNTKYSQYDLLNAFALFAEPDGPSGCISHRALRAALV